jgi:excisionase family DNA binding protein
MESTMEPESQHKKRPTLRPRVVSIDGAASYIGRSRAFIYGLIASGVIGAVKSGARTLPILDDLDAYLDDLPRADVRPAHPERVSKQPRIA